MKSHSMALASLILAMLTTSTTPASATEVRILRTTGAPAFLEGESKGVSIDRLGVVRLSEPLLLQTEIAEPFLLSAASHPDGWVLGTGNSGRVFLVERRAGRPSEEARELMAAEEEEIFAVLAAADGTVFVGSSPDGKVYRVSPEGEVFVVWESGESYIWALAQDSEGRLLVATGNNGKLFRLTLGADQSSGEASTQVEELYDDRDPHIRSLLWVPGWGEKGSLLVGTAGEGRVLRIDEQGKAVSLYDADQPEITALALGPDDEIYLAAVASEASLVSLGPSPAAKEQPQPSGNGAGDATPRVEVSEANAASGSRPAGYQGPRSDIVRLLPNGSAESVGKLRRETVYSLLWAQRLWVGTGQSGKLFSLRDELVLEQDLDSNQLMALLPVADDEGAFVVAATDAAGLYAKGEDEATEGTYSSDVLDAKFGADLGTLHWEGDIPPGGRIDFAMRSGFSASADETWSEWHEVGRALAESPAPTFSLSEVPTGRYVQWRARLQVGDQNRSPELRAVEFSYLQQNRRPEIEELDVLDPGEVLVASNFNPSNQAFEALTPNRDGVFTHIGDPASDGRTKKLWKRGYRTLRWEASDPNEDRLEYSLYVRPEGAAADEWITIDEGFDATHMGVDATVLPDGRYRFKVRVSDAPSNERSKALQAERVTGSVIVDHSPPRIDSLQPGDRASGGDSTWTVTVVDELLPLREISYSIDAKEWVTAGTEDGLVDSRREVVSVPVPADSRLVLLRVVDGAFNQRTFDLLSLRDSAAQSRRRR